MYRFAAVKGDGDERNSNRSGDANKRPDLDFTFYSGLYILPLASLTLEHGVS